MRKLIFFCVAVAAIVGVVVVLVTKRPAAVYAKLAPLVPCKGGDQRYRKLDLGTHKDAATTSFFDDDALEQRET